MCIRDRHGELQHLTKDRRELTIEARWTLIRDNEGRPKSCLLYTSIAGDFSTLKGDLKLHHESTIKIAEGVAKVETMHQDNQDLVKYFVKQARFNWLTIGFLGGIIFDSIANEIPAPHWLPLVVFAVGAGWLQWLFREFWIYLRSRTDKTSPATQTKPTG